MTPLWGSFGVERLDRLGLVRRETAPEDRRGNYAILQPAGTECLDQALDGHVPLVRASFLERFSREELEVMADFWRRVEAGLAASASDDPTARQLGHVNEPQTDKA